MVKKKSKKVLSGATLKLLKKLKAKKATCGRCEYIQMYYPDLGADGVKNACCRCNPALAASGQAAETAEMRANRMDAELARERDYLVTHLGGRYKPAEPEVLGKPADRPRRQAEHATGKPTTAKKPGVIARIVELLRAASKKKPTTKEAILKDLTETFPDRRPEAMRNTIGSQIPSGLKTEKGLIVKTDGKLGVWLDD